MQLTFVFALIYHPDSPPGQTTTRTSCRLVAFRRHRSYYFCIILFRFWRYLFVLQLEGDFLFSRICVTVGEEGEEKEKDTLRATLDIIRKWWCKDSFMDMWANKYRNRVDANIVLCGCSGGGGRERVARGTWYDCAWKLPPSDSVFAVYSLCVSPNRGLKQLRKFRWGSTFEMMSNGAWIR